MAVHGRVRFIPAWAGNTKKGRRPLEVTTVHPRVGGEHYGVPQIRHRLFGSSPRGRGTLSSALRCASTCRFIPAWAGNTLEIDECPNHGTVHPRVGGEHSVSLMMFRKVNGSSPRGRGTRMHTVWRKISERFIPAWAGNTSAMTLSNRATTVHPRVGGEHLCASGCLSSGSGSSPRGRGTLVTAVVRTDPCRFIPAWAGNTGPARGSQQEAAVHPRVGGEHCCNPASRTDRIGSSPRGRGTRVRISGLGMARRFIPAWAGNTLAVRVLARQGTVHPRVGGEHVVLNIACRQRYGSSPRGRGTRDMEGRLTGRRRFIPAWAGNTEPRLTTLTLVTVHPRVGGEHQTEEAPEDTEFGSSPRGRGTLGWGSQQHSNIRFIPAWAGNTGQRRTRQEQTTVHPRVGGEHPSRSRRSRQTTGSSPRGRGTRGLLTDMQAVLRFIPAWAGNTGQQLNRSMIITVHPRVGGEHFNSIQIAIDYHGSSPRGRGTLSPGFERTMFGRFIPAWAGNTTSHEFLAVPRQVHPRVGGEHREYRERW